MNSYIKTADKIEELYLEYCTAKRLIHHIPIHIERAERIIKVGMYLNNKRRIILAKQAQEFQINFDKYYTPEDKTKKYSFADIRSICKEFYKNEYTGKRSLLSIRDYVLTLLEWQHPYTLLQELQEEESND